MFQPYYNNISQPNPIPIQSYPIVPITQIVATNLSPNQIDYKIELQMLLNNPNSDIKKQYNEIISINTKGKQIDNVSSLFSIIKNENNKYKLFYNWLILRNSNDIRNVNSESIKTNLYQYNRNQDKRYFILAGLLIIFDFFQNNINETASTFYNDYNEGDKPLTDSMFSCINDIKNKNIDMSDDLQLENNINKIIDLLGNCYDTIVVSNKNSGSIGFFSGGKRRKTKRNKKVIKRKTKTNKKSKSKKLRKNKKITSKNKRKYKK